MQEPIINGRFHQTLTYKEVHQVNGVHKRYFTVIFSREVTPAVMNWRCYNCGGIVFQYYNHPRAAFDGAVNISELEKPTDHLCRKCNIIFRVS